MGVFNTNQQIITPAAPETPHAAAFKKPVNRSFYPERIHNFQLRPNVNDTYQLKVVIPLLPQSASGSDYSSCTWRLFFVNHLVNSIKRQANIHIRVCQLTEEPDMWFPSCLSEQGRVAGILAAAAGSVCWHSNRAEAQRRADESFLPEDVMYIQVCEAAKSSTSSTNRSFSPRGGLSVGADSGFQTQRPTTWKTNREPEASDFISPEMHISFE